MTLFPSGVTADNVPVPSAMNEQTQIQAAEEKKKSFGGSPSSLVRFEKGRQEIERTKAGHRNRRSQGSQLTPWDREGREQGVEECTVSALSSSPLQVGHISGTVHLGHACQPCSAEQ